MLFGLSHQRQHTSFPLVVMDQVLCLPRRTAGVAVGKIQQVKLEPAKHETDPQWIHGTFGPVQSHRRFKQDVLVFYAYKQITLKKKKCSVLKCPTSLLKRGLLPSNFNNLYFMSQINSNMHSKVKQSFLRARSQISGAVHDHLFCSDRKLMG